VLFGVPSSGQQVERQYCVRTTKCASRRAGGSLRPRNGISANVSLGQSALLVK
jgi:hypothetical protein